MSGSELVRRILVEYGGMATAKIAEYLQERRPHPQLYDLVADYPGRGGRALRASLCIAAARAFGADGAAALNTAVSLELLHNAFLVHDDIEDDSEERRGRPTMHLLHGVPVAVNVGDALTVLSLGPLIENQKLLGSALAFRILEEAYRMARESVEGQALELWWRNRNVTNVEEADYFEMILKKTCWYTTIYPLRAGALIGTRGAVDLDRYLRFGFFLGAAFQIQDDLLNLIGDVARYGKEINGDIWEGKRTLMLVHLLGMATPDERTRIAVMLGRTRSARTSDDVLWIRGLMEHYGSIEYARQTAHGLAGAALHEFDVAFVEVKDSVDKRFLHALPTWVIDRA